MPFIRKRSVACLPLHRLGQMVVENRLLCHLNQANAEKIKVARAAAMAPFICLACLILGEVVDNDIGRATSMRKCFV